MVHITTFMVAAAAVMMGVQSLDHSSAEAIGSQLVASEVLPSASVSEVHADGLFDGIEDFFKNLPTPAFGLPPFSFGPLPKISDTPDNTIDLKIPGATHSVVKGKRAVHDDEVSSAAPSASASASASHAHSHSHHKSAVKAALRARGMRGAGFRAAQFKSKSAEEHSASASASSAHAEPSHLARRDNHSSVGGTPSSSAESSEITPVDEDLDAVIAEAELKMSDIDKLGSAFFGGEAYASITRAFAKEVAAHSSDIAALSSLAKKAGSIKLPKATHDP
ncbi:unnamed protein product [Mucor hiemalis]